MFASFFFRIFISLLFDILPFFKTCSKGSYISFTNQFLTKFQEFEIIVLQLVLFSTALFKKHDLPKYFYQIYKNVHFNYFLLTNGKFFKSFDFPKPSYFRKVYVYKSCDRKNTISGFIIPLKELYSKRISKKVRYVLWL